MCYHIIDLVLNFRDLNRAQIYKTPVVKKRSCRHKKVQAQTKPNHQIKNADLSQNQPKNLFNQEDHNPF